MKPALSVIFFTVLSGAGYGVWCLVGAALAAGIYPQDRIDILLPLGFGFVLVTAGLMASTAHLGRPERAWRALTQWRSSWLSREGIAALVAYLPLLMLAYLAWRGAAGTRVLGALLAVCALATIGCTANIYRSLKTIRAWRARQVAPLYFMFACLSGGLWLWAWLASRADTYVSDAFPLALLVLAIVTALIKVDYWRGIDALPAPTAGHATGLEMLGAVRAFEGPVTEESYLTREMAFVLARKHSARLRPIALTLFAAVPALAIAIALPSGAGWLAIVAAAAASGGVLVERWLFFAEARHAVAAFFPRAVP
ncbi:MAG: dimethyl sulfoxide reductase anchor subunit [Rhodanobacteraceae bacterium]|nr:MAG: dimethyl sulfoxide reductase anchor subunit [Rhodanobacteraceae bacterium]